MSYDIYCDVTKCKSVIEDKKNTYLGVSRGWNTITITAHGISSQQFHLCPECLKKFGMGLANTSPNYGQQLLDIIYNIVQEEIANSSQG